MEQTFVWVLYQLGERAATPQSVSRVCVLGVRWVAVYWLLSITPHRVLKARVSAPVNWQVITKQRNRGELEWHLITLSRRSPLRFAFWDRVFLYIESSIIECRLYIKPRDAIHRRYFLGHRDLILGTAFENLRNCCRQHESDVNFQFYGV